VLARGLHAWAAQIGAVDTEQCEDGRNQACEERVAE
jgi:hypothetical protein